MTIKHLVHSHAHAGELPGTVDLSATEGDDTVYGNALYPVPAEDPNDPLQWPTSKKTIILVICSLYSSFGSAALLGPSVYISLYAEEFGISPNDASGLVSYPNLVYSWGTLVLVPSYLKFGRRLVMLVSLLLFLAGLIGCSQANSYGGLMAARIVQTFGSGVCEALPVQLVNDIFYLNERGTRLGYYTVSLCLGATAPLFAGYMLAGGYSWRLFFYVLIAFVGALLIVAFFFVQETAYKRHTESRTPSSSDQELGKEVSAQRVEVVTMVPPPKTFAQTLKVWSGVDHEAEFFMTIARSFTYLLIPSVLWVVTTYGIYIGLGGLAFNYTFPIKIVAPPYSWSPTNSGLIALATIIGYALAIPLTSTSDRLAAYLTRKNSGIREAEMRLGVMFPAMLLGPAGLVIYGLAAERNLHWILYFIGVALVDWAAYFYFTFTLAYAVDSLTANTSEMLIAINLGKAAVSFGIGGYLLDWILTTGYAKVIAGAFVGVVLANNLALLPFLWKGKAIRRFMAGTPLARLHRLTADTEGMA